MKKVLALLLALLFMLSIAACGTAATPTAAPTEAPAQTSQQATEAPPAEPTMAAEPEFIFRYADNQPEDYPTTVAAKRFADLVFERTNGRIGYRTAPIWRHRFLPRISFSSCRILPVSERAADALPLP